MRTLTVRTERREELRDITDQVRSVLAAEGVDAGLCHLFSPHTTCGVIVNEGWDPDVADDVLRHLGELAPREHGWRHAEGNSDAHLKTILVGADVTIPVAGGRPSLGRWQRIFLAEFDGPRQRELWLTPLAG